MPVFCPSDNCECRDQPVCVCVGGVWGARWWVLGFGGVGVCGDGGVNVWGINENQVNMNLCAFDEHPPLSCWLLRT